MSPTTEFNDYSCSNANVNSSESIFGAVLGVQLLARKYLLVKLDTQSRHTTCKF